MVNMGTYQAYVGCGCFSCYVGGCVWWCCSWCVFGCVCFFLLLLQSLSPVSLFHHPVCCVFCDPSGKLA